MELKLLFVVLFMLPLLNAKPMNTVADYIEDEEENVEEGGKAALDHILEVNGLNFKHVDMIYTAEQEKAESPEGVQGDLALNARRWPKSGSTVNIPYVIQSANAQARRALDAAFDDFRKKTCIRFVTRTNQQDYVRVIAGGGCYSYVGRIGGRQDLSLGRGCERTATAVHEFMHALGYFHEQSRPDRDQHIKINTGNIQSQFLNQFRKETTDNQGTPYDYVSVMHYGPYAFSKAYGRLVTIERKSSTDRLKLGNNVGLSDLDAESVNKAYCAGTPTVTTTTTKKPGTGINKKTIQGWFRKLRNIVNAMRRALNG